MNYAEQLELNAEKGSAYAEYLAIIDAFPDKQPPKEKAELLGQVIQDSLYAEGLMELNKNSNELAIQRFEDAYHINRDAGLYGLHVIWPDSLFSQKYLDDYFDEEMQKISAMSDSSAILNIKKLSNYFVMRNKFSKKNGDCYHLSKSNARLDSLANARWVFFLTRLLSNGAYSDVVNTVLTEKLFRDENIFRVAISAGDSMLQIEKKHCNRLYLQQKYQELMDEYSETYQPLLKRLYPLKLGTPDAEITSWYSQSQKQVDLASAQENYQKGLELESAKQYFAAINMYRKAQSFISGFKDSDARINTIREIVSLGIGVVAIKDNHKCSAIGSSITSSIVGLSNSFSPYFEIADRTNLFDVMSEQALWQTGVVENPENIKFGKLVGAKWLVFGKIEACDVVESVFPKKTEVAYFLDKTTYYKDRSPTDRNAFSQKEKIKSCQVKVTHYFATPEIIKVYKGTKKVTVVVSLKIIDVETGKFIYNKKNESSEIDNITYADCGGCETSRLSTNANIPQDIISSDCRSLETRASVFTSVGNRENRTSPVDDALFSARKKFISSFEMENLISKKMQVRIENEINTAISDYFETY